MDKVWNAACACGQMSVRLRGAPKLVSSCCCEACQRRGGAFVSVTVFFDDDQVLERRGETRTWRRTGESGHVIDFSFCPTCGSTVWWRAQARPGTVLVAGGCMTDPELPGPERLIWTDYRHPSVRMAENVREYPRGPN